MRVIGVIPARYASTRLPAKPLVKIAGKSLVRWVWEAASRATKINELLIATDDERIAAVCRSFGAEAVMTSPDCASGSDRIAEAIAGREADIIVNIQGDEPLMPAANIDACVEALQNDSAAHVATAMIPIHDEQVFKTPSVVKVVYDSNGYALYFSRAMIPDRSRVTDTEQGLQPFGMKHLGLYVYRRAALDAFVKMTPSRYEQLEKLEQLRFLDAGYKIKMVEVMQDSIGVDTQEDVLAVEGRLAAFQS